MLRTTFTDRYAFAEARRGGATLLDLETGSFFSMNSSASEIWREFLRGEARESIIAAVVEKSKLPSSQVGEVVEAVLQPQQANRTVIQNSQWPAVGPTPYEILPAPNGGFDFLLGTRRLFHFCTETRVITRLAVLDELEWKQHLWSFSPNLLAMMGVPTLHAAGVVNAGRALLFSGPSGAGKTTTAQLWAQAYGAKFVCEDKAVLVHKAGKMELFQHAEAAVNGWVSEQASRLLISDEVVATGLSDAANGTTVEIASIQFLDVNQRLKGTPRLRTEALQDYEGVAFVLRQTFTGTGTREDWLDRFAWVTSLLSHVPVCQLFVPDGVPDLEKELRRRLVGHEQL